MSGTSPRSARLPRDVQARERLQRAQQVEAAAVATVYRAEGALARSRDRYDAAVAAAGTVVEQAQTDVARAQLALIEISGRDRAAQLLGLTGAELRKSIAAGRDGRADD